MDKKCQVRLDVFASFCCFFISHPVSDIITAETVNLITQEDDNLNQELLSL